MRNLSFASLSDSDLLTETARAAGVERSATADLLALLAEVDHRRLYLGLGCSSLFTYCTQALRLSEPAAYARITAARAAARWPAILKRLAAGDVTLTAITLLAAHWTDDNHEALLDAARHKTKRDIEQLVARLDPQPDVPSVLRRLPAPAAIATNLPPTEPPKSSTVPEGPATASASPPRRPRAIVAPLSADRYLLKVTLSESAHADLERVRELLRHTVPSGDPAVVVARALSVLRQQLERTRHAPTRRPNSPAQPGSRTSRHVPAEVRRAVWARDEGRCAFVGTDGRCTATAFLELHHVQPFARGGPTTADNLELRCRAHNAYEAERDFGVRHRGRPGRTASEQQLCLDRVGGQVTTAGPD